jgi:hypothetical protein
MKYLTYFLIFVAGMFAMATLEYVQNGNLPNCQEDEYLYPLDYTGENRPRDYECWNFDDTYQD